MRVPSPDVRRSLAELVAKYHKQADGVATYLAERGIYREAIDRFQLGFTGNNGDPKTANRLAIPYSSPHGPWLIKYRCIEDHNCKNVDHHSKYINDDNGAGLHLFNAQVLRDADLVVVTEGELDAIAVTMTGVSAVGYPGVDSWQKYRYWRYTFDSVEQVIVVADGDEPQKGQSIGVGLKAARHVAGDLRNTLPDLDVSVVEMPEEYDSNKFIHEHGVLAFLEKIGVIDG